MKLSKFATELKAKGFEINFDHEFESNIRPEDCFSEQEDIDYVKQEYEWNESAWFMCDIWLSLGGVNSDREYLGGCSYKSFDEFTGTDNDYFDDMLQTCYDNLKTQFKKIQETAFPEILM